MEDKETYEFRQKLRNFLVPGGAEAFFYIFVGSLIITLINIGVIIDLLLDSSKVSSNIFDSLYTSDRYYDFMETGFAWMGNVVVWIFWGLLACTVYASIWSVQNFLLVAHDETQEANYISSSDKLQTKNYTILIGKPKSKYWRSSASKNIFFVSILFLYIGSILIYLLVLLPLISKVFLIGAYTLPDIRSIGLIISSFLFNTFLLYGYILLQRILIYSWRVIKPKEIV